MRHPVLTVFAAMSFIGATSFVVACAKDNGPDIEPIIGAAPTDPANDPDSGVNKNISIPGKEKKKTPKDAGATTPPAVVDAGADTGAKPAPTGDDDDDNVLIADCPNDQAHILSWTLISTTGGGTTCTSHGSECSTGQCCFVYPIPGLGQNYCVPQ